MIRVGAFDLFSESRTAQFWQFRELAQWPHEKGQGLLLAGSEKPQLPEIGLREPSRVENLIAEQELLGFTINGHPLDLHPGIAWETYCPIAEIGAYAGQRVTVAGLIIESRVHRQGDGRNMKFISLCDYTGILECELFADAYRRFGILTVRHPIIEVTGKIERFESGQGCTLSVQRIGAARRSRVNTG